MSGVVFTRSMQLVDSREVPLASCSEDKVGAGEAFSAFPFTSTGTAQAGEIAVVTLSGSGTHWVTSGDSPTPAAGTGVPVSGPGTYMFQVEPGEKIGIAT